MHTLEVHGFNIYGEFVGRLHILVELDSAYFNYFSAQFNRELVKYGGFGAHCLIPLQIDHDIIHS